MAVESNLDRLAEARQQISALKIAEHPVVRLVSPDGPIEHKVAYRPWGDVAEGAKLSMLQDMVDWSGITNKDMAHILLGELDVGKLTEGQRDLLIRLAAPEMVMGEKLSLNDLRRNGDGHHKENSRERGMER